MLQRKIIAKKSHLLYVHMLRSILKENIFMFQSGFPFFSFFLKGSLSWELTHIHWYIFFFLRKLSMCHFSTTFSWKCVFVSLIKQSEYLGVILKIKLISFDKVNNFFLETEQQKTINIKRCLACDMKWSLETTNVNASLNIWNVLVYICVCMWVCVSNVKSSVIDTFQV